MIGSRLVQQMEMIKVDIHFFIVNFKTVIVEVRSILPTFSKRRLNRTYQPQGEPNEPNPPTYLGRLCLFYPSGDEGGAGVL